jgi:2-oxoglutarate dehydrogenase E1 component
VLDDSSVTDPSSIRKILVCNGKIYYELLAAREQRRASDETAAHTAIIRMEQLYPFPQFEFEEVLRRYPKASGVVWVQEEPHNMGAWSFVRPRIVTLLRQQGREIGYAGRPDSASTAPGSSKRHAQEQADLIGHAFDPPVLTPRARRRLVKRLKGMNG